MEFTFPTLLFTVYEGITNVSLLESIVKFVASSIGNPISAKKISDTISSSGCKNSVNTVDRYPRALTDSYIFYKANRYDIKGRQHLKTLGKYYLVSATLLDETTLTRELEPLQKIPDHHPKVLLTLDEIGAGKNYDGIK